MSATTGATVTASPTATTTYTVTGTTGTCTNTKTVTVTVNPKPTIAATAVRGASCVFTLNATGATSYSWSPTTGLSATTGATITSSAKQNIEYTVTGTSANGCTNTAKVTTVVAPITITPPTATFCEGGYVTLQAFGAIGSTCTWTPTTGLTPAIGVAVTAKPTGTTVYTVSGTDDNGCTAKGNLTITVNPLPKFTFPTAPSVCKGNSVSIKASNDVGFNYTWSPATGLDNPSAQTVMANPTQTTTYFVSATHPTTTCSNIGTVTVNVVGTVAPQSRTICAGTSTTLTATGATSYTWSPAIGLNQTTGATVVASPTTNQVYSVTGTNSCGTNPPEFVSILVTPLPNIDLTPPSATVPSGAPVTLTASGSDNYAWSPATYLNTTSGTSVVCTPTSSTTYNVSSTTNNCTATKSIFVEVVPAPVGLNASNPASFRLDAMPQGTSYSDTKNNNPANRFWNDYGQPSDDIFYKFTISQASRVKIQHCNTSSTGIEDSYMHLLNWNSKLLHSNDDKGTLCASSLRSSMDIGLSAGTYYIVSEGFESDYGDIKTDVEVLPCSTGLVGSTKANPIIINNSIGSCFFYAGTLLSNGCMGNEYGQPAEDIYYKFTLNSPQKVNVSSCGSTFFDTYLTILDSTGAYITSNDDYGPICSSSMNASISQNLPVGTYYVVLEGYSNNCGMMKIDLSTPSASCPNLRQESETEYESIESSKAKLKEMDSFTKTINVYPNPSLGDIIVDLNESTDATVVLVDMLGQIVAEKQLQAGSNSFKFEGSHLPKGMYIVKVLGSKLSKTVFIK